MTRATQIVQVVDQGQTGNANELLCSVYDELRRIAAAKMAQEQPGQTLQPTALVHEAWLKLAGSTRQEWHDQRHFVSAAAEAMRRILIDRARKRHRSRHGHGLERIDLNQVEVAAASSDDAI